MPTTLPKPSADEYLDLVLAFPLRPIRSRSAHEKAKTFLRSLAGRRGSAVRDYKIILASIIADYERSAHHGLDLSKVTAAEIVHHLLSERDMSVNALAKAVGISQSSLSEMLNGRRDWSKAAIVSISSYFRLEPAVFLK